MVFSKSSQGTALLAQQEQAEGNTPLHIAVACYSPDLVQSLLDAGSPKELLDNKGQTALMMARNEMWRHANDEVTDSVREVKMARISAII